MAVVMKQVLATLILATIATGVQAATLADKIDADTAVKERFAKQFAFAAGRVSAVQKAQELGFSACGTEDLGVSSIIEFRVFATFAPMLTDDWQWGFDSVANLKGLWPCDAIMADIEKYNRFETKD